MTTQAASINFRLYPYATFEEVTTLTDALGDPIDLTGRTARCQIRRERSDATTLYDLSTTALDGITLGGAAGTVTLYLSDVETALYDIDEDGETWCYDLLISDGTRVERTYQGYIFVIPGVTRV